jgi:Raf kinase inhibitor-like YbhB/YbcL family protein
VAQGESPSPGGKHGPAVPQPTAAPAPTITPQQRREATVASMSLQSPSSQPSSGGPQALAAEYTCDGKNTSPALRWQGVPQGTAELVLFVMNAQPVGGELFFDWAVAGLSPELEEIEAGKLPRGAVAGRNSFGKTGYEICPEDGGETYVFTLFALPKSLSPAQGFEPLALRKSVASVSGNVGLLALSYGRG